MPLVRSDVLRLLFDGQSIRAEVLILGAPRHFKVLRQPGESAVQLRARLVLAVKAALTAQADEPAIATFLSEVNS